MKYKALFFIFSLFISTQAASALNEEWRLIWKKGTQKDVPQQIVELYQSNKKVFEVTEFMLEVPIFANYKLHQDSNYLVVQGYTGGAHCCSWVKVISLKSPVQVIATLDIPGVMPLWIDVDHDGKSELITNDYTFDYWYTPHSNSALPDVILKFNGKKFKPDMKLMKKKQQTALMVRSRAEEIKKTKSYWDTPMMDNPPFKLPHAATGAITAEILNLLYAGQAELARIFLNIVWPDANPHKGVFIKALNTQLKKSSYWPELEAQGFKALP